MPHFAAFAVRNFTHLRFRSNAFVQRISTNETLRGFLIRKMTFAFSEELSGYLGWE